ncbi:hypothetical protein G7Y89_g3328 [Cudoniella acicularis]|uniref:Uncharacterized protein n=1 Tax=Cudoniella acicularis TaxID=354080 RepID=A0A8H4RRL1_9HELO|nr:hypothetical protein G7Y89_g3328 [Cudoniella acicularis]
MGNSASKEVLPTISYTCGDGPEKVVEVPLIETRDTGTTIETRYDMTSLRDILNEMDSKGEMGKATLEFRAAKTKALLLVPGHKSNGVAMTFVLVSFGLGIGIAALSIAHSRYNTSNASVRLSDAQVERVARRDPKSMARAAEILVSGGYSKEEARDFLHLFYMPAKRAVSGENKPDLSMAASAGGFQLAHAGAAPPTPSTQPITSVNLEGFLPFYCEV